MRTKGKVDPGKGGCWYCFNDDEPISFCHEFDTAIHIECIQDHVRRMLEKVGDMEAEIIFREFMNEGVL